MDLSYNTEPKTQEQSKRVGRVTETKFLEQFRQAQQSKRISLREFAKQNHIPESTMRHWLQRTQRYDANEKIVAFIESPEGLQFVHRIVVAAAYTFTQQNGAGVRSMCDFLKYSNLSQFVASGFGTQQKSIVNIEELINQFGREQGTELALKMTPKDITIGQDETFHNKPCLLAIEMASNFILAEQYADDRTANTWNEVMQNALKDLPVTVIQSTSDEGTALLSHAEKCLEAHHSPDLFHPLQDISRATSLPLARKEEEANRAIEKARTQMNKLMDNFPQSNKKASYTRRLLKQADEKEAIALSERDDAPTRRQEVRTAKKGISESYHPFDLKTGKMRTPETVEKELTEHYDNIKSTADDAGLSQKCLALIAKARRLVPQMVATIGFVHTVIFNKVEGLDLSPDIEKAVLEYLIPGKYIESVAKKAPKAEMRNILKGQAKSLKEKAQTILMNRCDENERGIIDVVAKECAHLFQRSSSNVEGRNGVLALRHHSAHKLSKRKLGALTVIHNYGIFRLDGTTAAERFFGHSHDSLFEYILLNLPPPKRPAKFRSAVNERIAA